MNNCCLKKKIFLNILITLLLVSSLCCVSAAQTIKMVIAHHYPSSLLDNEVQLSLVRFKDIVEKETNGGITVEIYPNCSLGTEVEYTKEVQAGGKTIQSSVLSSGAFSSFFPSYQVMTCPFLFPDFPTAWAFFDSDFYLDFMKKLRAETGLRYLGTFDDGGGFVAFTNGKKLIKTPEDMQGLRIRVEENPAHVAIIEALGAKAVPLEWSQIQTCLATGVADGQFNAPGLNAAMKFWELVPYTSWTGHIYNTLNWVVSDEWFSQLSEEYQELIIRAAREAVLIGHGNAARLTLLGWEECKKNFEEAYMPTASEKEAFSKIAKPAFKNWYVEEFKGDEELLNNLLSEVDRIYKELGEIK
ncbi:MAG: TRAP transporter substrate-binding protein DctP [Caldisericia bacterium]|nr:TRAP transporter substrate-binding protein DctP [Caldisericia bacterium]